MSLSEKESNNYKIGFCSTRAWGCFQRGWMFMDDPCTEVLRRGLQKLNTLAESKEGQILTGKKADIQDALQIVNNGCPSPALSKLWRLYHEMLHYPGFCYGDICVYVFESIAGAYQLDSDNRVAITKEMRNEFKSLESPTVLT